MNQTLIGPDGVTPLRAYAGYTGGGGGFGGQIAHWLPPSQSVDAALLPQFERGNARADDLVRNNGYAANGVQLHQDHIVGSFFRLSYRPNWRYLGLEEKEARAFSDEVEAAWREYAEDPDCCLDVERKRTFTMMIREGVAMHAFNGEVFIQPCWSREARRLFRTQFKMVSPKRVGNAPGVLDSSTQRAGVKLDKYGAAVGYYVSEDTYPGRQARRWAYVPRELPNGRPCMIHVFEPLEDGQTRGANRFYSVMEQMKMLDTLQNTQLQSAIVKAMYAATIESELDTDKAFEYLLGAGDDKGQPSQISKLLEQYLVYYQAAQVKFGGAKVPHLFPGDELKLQTAQDTDNGFSVFEQSLLRYIAAGLGVSYEQLSRDYSQVSYSSVRASANESWRYFLGRRKFIASRQASMMFSCWLEEALVRGVVKMPARARFSFLEARCAWSNSEWIGAGRMAIDGLKEVQESVMLIEAGLSTYEKECGKLGEDYPGMTGYNGIVARVKAAIDDPEIDGILLDMDTPGGMVAGSFDAADMIARLRDQKPIWSLANDMNCSAGQLIASACSRRLVTQTAKTGSIGVMMAHSNYASQLERDGIDITLIFSGVHKVDAHPYGALPEDVRAACQEKMDAIRQSFAEKVSRYTGMTVQAVLDTEAAVYTGQASIEAGLADELVINTDALAVMREFLRHSKTIRSIGGQMSVKQNQGVAETVTETDAATVPTTDEKLNAGQGEANVAAVVQEAVQAEQARIIGILDCEEAKGRDAAARALAATPGMTIENAQRILASMPESAQIRTETSLDRLMADAPEALGAGTVEKAKDNDLMTIPV